MDEEILDEAVLRLQAESLYNEQGLEYAKDTFNPSTLFNDKTQAEWFGNIVKNRESDALKSIIQSAQKPSKMLYVMVGLVGFLGGIMVVLLFSGGLFTGTGGKTTTSTYIPPAPPASSSGIIGYGLSLVSSIISMVL